MSYYRIGAVTPPKRKFGPTDAVVPLLGIALVVGTVMYIMPDVRKQ